MEQKDERDITGQDIRLEIQSNQKTNCFIINQQSYHEINNYFLIVSLTTLHLFHKTILLEIFISEVSLVGKDILLILFDIPVCYNCLSR